MIVALCAIAFALVWFGFVRWGFRQIDDYYKPEYDYYRREFDRYGLCWTCSQHESKCACKSL